MNKLLAILGMVFLAFVLITSDAVYAQTPTLSSPPDNYQETVNSTGSITLYWIDTYATWSRDFELQVDNNSDFSSPVYYAKTGKVGSKKITGLLPGVTYYWRVRCEYLYIFSWVWSSWSGARNFKFVIPELLGPPSGVTDQVQPLNLTWRAIADPMVMNTGHQILIDNDADFNSPVYEKNTHSSNHYVSGLAYNTKFYWKVRYYFTLPTAPYTTTYYNWSAVRNFSTGCDIPGMPALNAPANNATNLTQPIALSWSSIEIADDYKIQIATNAGFSPNVVDQYVGSNSYQASGLEDGTKYYWRVAARNECGSSSFASYRNFTTICPEPSPPDLVSPSDGAVDLSMPFILDWNGPDVSGGEYYRVVVDDNDNFSSPEIDESPTSSQYTVSSGLESGVTYYWRVMFHNDCGNSVWGPVRDFTMECPTPALPTLELPGNGTADLEIPISFDWSDAAGATKYQIVIDDDESFGSPEISMSSFVSGYSADGLDEDGTTYYWRVRAGNDCQNWSGWTGIWSFTINCRTLDPPTLVFPSDGQDDLDGRNVYAFDWDDVKGASAYGIQISFDENMADPFVDEKGVELSTYKILEPVPIGTWVYWRVNAEIDVCGNGEWSPIWKFQTFCPSAETPVLLSPSDGALNVPQPIAIDWGDVEDDLGKFEIQVDDNADFSSPEFTENNVSSSDLELPNLTEGVSYYWRIRVNNGCQNGDWSNVWSFVPGVPSDIEIVTGLEIPVSFALKQNYPNPFNPTTTMEFSLPRAEYVVLEIHNILGEKVVSVISQHLPAGNYSANWNAAEAPTGIYFYRIQAGDFTQTRKMVLLK